VAVPGAARLETLSSLHSQSAPAEPKPEPDAPTSPAASSSASAEEFDAWNVKHQEFHDN
jgi:hypothetical protein